MKTGDVVKVRSIRHRFEGGWADFKAPRGQDFVLLLLGVEPSDGSAPLEPDEVLREMGWTFSESEES